MRSRIRGGGKRKGKGEEKEEEEEEVKDDNTGWGRRKGGHEWEG